MVDAPRSPLSGTGHLAGTGHLSGTEHLAAIRREIALLDREIVELIARRIHLAGEAAGVKTGMGLSIRDPQVEAVVIRSLEAACPGLGLHPGLGRELASFLIGCALDSERHLAGEAVSRSVDD